MAINIPTGTTQYNIEDDGKTYILKANSTLDVTGSDSAIFGANGFNDDKIIVNGDITQTGSAFAAVVLSGDSMVLQLSTTGSIVGTSGAEFIGANSKVINDGNITSTAANGYGVYFEGLNTEITNTRNIIATGLDGSAIGAFGDNSEIHNNGKLQGAFGINATDHRTTVDLGQNSRVIGTEAAIFSESTESTDKIHLTNDGKITGQGGGYAIQLGDGNDTVINHGTIAGRIYMGTGKDIFVEKGGTLDHKVEGGAGDDLLITDNAGTKLKENGGSEGFDTVRSSVSYVLSANVEQLILTGNNNINGKGTADGSWLTGNSGNNKLTGVDGSGSDTFIFKTGGGHDTLMDFDAGTDKIDVSKWNGLDNLQEIKQHAVNSGGDVHINFGGDELIILNTTKNDLHNGDFIF